MCLEIFTTGPSCPTYASLETAGRLQKVTQPPAICLPRGIARLRSGGLATVFRRVMRRPSSPAKVARAEVTNRVARSAVSCPKGRH